nr:diguanylate cyclase [Maliibacterium massiliense]
MDVRTENGTIDGLDRRARIEVFWQREMLREGSLAAQLNSIAACLPVGVGIYELEGETVYPVFVSDMTLRLFGFSRAEYDAYIGGGKPIFAMEDLRACMAQRHCAGGRTQVVNLELKTKTRQGAPLWVRVQGQVRYSQDALPLVYAVFTDLTEEKRAARKARWENERYRILNALTHAVSYDYDVETDTMRYYIDTDGKGVQERVLPHYVQQVLATARSTVDPQSTAYAASFRLAAEGQLSGQTEYRANYFGGGYRWYRTQWQRITPEDGGPYHLVGLVEDIEEERHLRRKAEVDAVTGLCNRATTEELINQALAVAPRALCVCAVVDIDNFKAINDRYGHLQGDEVLRQLGHLLRGNCRETDVVGRVGGDEFILFYKNIRPKVALRRLAALEVQSRTMLCPDGRQCVTLSIGVCASSGTERCYRQIVDKADSALYQAKRRGKGCIEVYNAAAQLQEGKMHEPS